MIRWNMKNNIYTFKKKELYFYKCSVYLFIYLMCWCYFILKRKFFYIFYLKNKIFLNKIKNSYRESCLFLINNIFYLYMSTIQSCIK